MPAKNLRSIDNIDTNDMNFKHLETTKDIVISPKNEYGDPQRPDPSHKWTAKVSDGTNYVGDYLVEIKGASLIVDSEDFTKLPVGKYMLEVWEQWTDPDGNSQLSIYPSPQQTIPFTIYANITDQAGKEIKKIGFQDVVDQAVMNIGMNYVFKVNAIEPDQAATVVQMAADGKNYVTFNIPRGAKGDKGDKGNTGDRGPQGIQGIQGPQGKTGPTGPVGPAPTLRVGSVTKVAPGGTPTASVTGSNGSYAINLGIPEGQQGAKGDGFTDYGNITKTGDLNDYMRTGVADIQASMANKPAGYEGNWGVLKVFAPDNGSHHIVQEWYPSGTSNGTMFFRYYTVSGSSGSGKWDPWQKMGGVTGTNLLPSSTMPTMRQGSVQSTAHLSAQRFSNFIVNNETLPTPDIIIKPLVGDTIQQSFIVRTDGIIESLSLTFFDTINSYHNIVPCTVTMIDTKTYLVSASFTLSKLINIRCLDLFRPNITGASYVEFDSPYVGLVQSGGGSTN